jgi:O-antigen/teichoic acid export membrane protein
MNLKQKALNGILWVSLDLVMVRGMAFATSIYLTYLLRPEEFGLIGMTAVFIAIGNVLVDSGLSESLIRTKEDSNIQYCSVFYVNVSLGLLIYLVFFFLSPLIADFFDQQRLTKIIRIYSLSFVFTSFSMIHLTRLIKKMRFKRITALSLPGAIFGSAAGISLGYMGYGVWSIVAMYLVTQALQVLMVWTFSDWRPKFLFSRKEVEKHINFGYKLLIAGVINALFNNIYNVVIGKFFFVKNLGYYERSYAFSHQPVTILSSIINKVAYPTMATIQDNKEKMAKVYKNLFQVSFFLITPVIAIVIAISENLFEVVFGNNWLPAVPYFKILCVAAIFYPINSFNLNVLKVFGKTNWFLKLEIIKKLVVALGVTIGVFFGILGLLYSAVITSIISVFINSHYSNKLIAYSTKQQIFDLLPTTILSIITYLLIVGLDQLIEINSKMLLMAIQIFWGLAFYMSISFFARIPAFRYTLKLLRQKKESDD